MEKYIQLLKIKLYTNLDKYKYIFIRTEIYYLFFLV